MTTKRVFISYSRRDEAVARQLADVLHLRDIEVWYDAKIRPGSNWWDDILEAIRAADSVILLLSPSAITSVPCQRERQYALDLRKHRIPILIGQERSTLTIGDLPFTIQNLNIVTYDGRSAVFEDIARAVLANDPQPLPDPLPDPPPPPIDERKTSHPLNLRLMLAAISIILLIIFMSVAIWLASDAAPSDAAVRPTLQLTDITMTDSTATDHATSTEAVASRSGPVDLSLLRGNADDITLYVNTDSVLDTVRLESTNGTLALIALFDVLIQMGRVPAGSCFILYHGDSPPVPPQRCQAEMTFRRSIAPGDAIWYDNFNAQPLTVFLMVGDDETRICPPTLDNCRITNS